MSVLKQVGERHGFKDATEGHGYDPVGTKPEYLSGYDEGWYEGSAWVESRKIDDAYERLRNE